MLALLSKSLKGMNGAAISGLDVLTSLSQTEHELAVIYKKAWEMPEFVDGYKIRQCETYPAPRYAKFPLVGDSSYFERIVKWLDSKIFDKSRSKNLENISPAMTFVNSFSSHVIYNSIKENFNWPGTLIIRESPRFIDFKNDGKGINNALNKMKIYENFIFVSSNVMNEWIKLNPLIKEKSHYIPNCAQELEIAQITKQKKSEVRKKLGLPKDKFIAVCVSSIQYRKGQDILVDNFDQILKVAPEIDLYFVGPMGGGEYQKQIYKNAKSDKHAEKIKFLGAKTNAKEYIYAADVFVLPTRAEALPRVILEAMLLKIPILSTDVDGIPEMIQNGESGFLFPLTNIDKMIDGFGKIYSDRKLCDKFTQNANNRYWSTFSRKHHIKRFADVIEKIVP